MLYEDTDKEDNRNKRNHNVNEDEDVDISWLLEYEKEDKKYGEYYAEDVTFIQLRIIYINRAGEISQLKTEKVFLCKANMLSREELLRIIKTHHIDNHIKYHVLSVLKYNFDISPLDLNAFMHSTDKHICTSYLHSSRNFVDIPYSKTIAAFHDMNELIILFHDKTPQSIANALVRTTSNIANTATTTKHATTKKIYLGSNVLKHNKTSRTNWWNEPYVQI